MINVKTFRFESKDRLDDTINAFAKDHAIVDIKLNTHIIDSAHPTRPATYYIALVMYTVDKTHYLTQNNLKRFSERF